MPDLAIKPYSPAQIINAGICIGCGSCAADNAPMELDGFGQFKPAANAQWLNTPSEAFARTCPFSPVAANETQIANDLYLGAPHGETTNLGAILNYYAVGLLL